MTIFYENITKLCKEKGITINGMCNLIGLSNATATQWKRGAKPSPKSLNKISAFFGIPTEELINKKECNSNKNYYPMDRFTNKVYGNIIALCKRNEITIHNLMNILKIPNDRMVLIKEYGSILDIDLAALTIFFDVDENEIKNGNLFKELDEIVNHPNQPTEKERIAEEYEKAPTYIQKAIKKLLNIENNN